MKTLGLIGGTSWVSTADYYRLINQQTNKKLGGISSAKILLYSVNFEEFRPPVDPGEWAELTAKFIAVAQNLEKGGADSIMLCANTPHLIAGDLRKQINIPLIHIAEAAAETIAEQKIGKIALLGTRVTMEQPFFREKLTEKGIEVMVPDMDDRQFMHDAVFNELTKDIFTAATKARFIQIIDGLISNGAEGVILACTEFPHLIKPEDCTVPTFDTTVMHVAAAVKFALGDI